MPAVKVADMAQIAENTPRAVGRAVGRRKRKLSFPELALTVPKFLKAKAAHFPTAFFVRCAVECNRGSPRKKVVVVGCFSSAFFFVAQVVQ